MNSRHHILFERSAYTSRPEARQLRTTQSLIPRIDREIHDELHDVAPNVPLLGSYSLRNVAGLFVPTGHTMEDIDGLLSAIDKGTKHPKTHMLERDLAGLAMQAIELQKPFIREGLLGKHSLYVVNNFESEAV